MERRDDFTERRTHLSELTEKELESRFWELTEQLVDPLIELSRGHTSPSIERSVLLRMGFSSLEAKAIVEKTIDHGLMGKGAGHVVYRVARDRGLEIRDAGLELAEGRLWEVAEAAFEGSRKGAGHGAE